MGGCCLRLLIALLDELGERWIQKRDVRTSEHFPALRIPDAFAGSAPSSLIGLTAEITRVEITR